MTDLHGTLSGAGKTWRSCVENEQERLAAIKAASAYARKAGFSTWDVHMLTGVSNRSVANWWQELPTPLDTWPPTTVINTLADLGKAYNEASREAARAFLSLMLPIAEGLHEHNLRASDIAAAVEVHRATVHGWMNRRSLIRGYPNAEAS